MTDRLACITLNVEPDEFGDPASATRSRTGYVWTGSAIPFYDLGASLTAFIVMEHAERYAPALAALASSIPLELAIHSYTHDRRPLRRTRYKRARDAFVRLWGKLPEGYRAPYGLIDGDGLRTLMDEGFIYDSSIFPTLRLDHFGYNNLRYPRIPFLFTDGTRELIEVPVAALRGCRLIYSLSFVKLFGHGLFRHLMPVFPLPTLWWSIFILTICMWAAFPGGALPAW